MVLSFSFFKYFWSQLPKYSYEFSIMYFLEAKDFLTKNEKKKQIQITFNLINNKYKGY